MYHIFNQYKLDEFIYQHLNEHVEADLKTLNCTINQDVLLITNFWESVEPTLWKPAFNRVLTQIRLRQQPIKILLILNSWYSNFDWKDTLELVDEIFFVDFFLLKTYLLLDYKKVNPVSTHWKPTSNKFLFLTGKPAKIHRTRLLYKLAQAGLLEHAIWSFFVTDMTKSACQKYLPELTDQEFNQFIKKYCRAPDLPQLMTLFNNSGYTGVPFDPKMYSESLFAIISETDFDRCYTFPWLTEKTWLHVANRLPFIMAGEHKTIQLLESMGFNTFREFLPVFNYDNPDDKNYLTFQTTHDLVNYLFKNPSYQEFYQSIRNPEWPELADASAEFINQRQAELFAYSEPILSNSEQRLNYLVYNSKYWLYNLHNQAADVNILVEQNRTQYLNIGQQELKKLESLFQKYQLKCSAVDFVLDQETNRNIFI